MKFLPDTHALVWALSNSAKLSKSAKRVFAEGEAVVSVAILWELLLKDGSRDALVAGTLKWWDDFVVKAGLSVISIRQPRVIEIGRLPPIHRDPFDRILIAQSIVEKIPLVSMDRKLSRYGVQILW